MRRPVLGVACRSRQNRAGSRLDRQGYRRTRGGEAARNIHHARLRSRAGRRGYGHRSDRHAGSRAFFTHDDLGRDRDRCRFYEREWSDGLPIVPPTVENIEEFLAFTDRPVVKWRKRMGIEPTARCSRATGFEDQGSHQASVASAIRLTYSDGATIAIQSEEESACGRDSG
jgi:hypothetical protein